MFGYVIPNDGALTEEERARYRSLYCGLCRTLGEEYGIRGRLTLTYDLTFLTLLLTSLYEPNEEQRTIRCLPHPFRTHDAAYSEITRYAAAMNVALAYHKLLDDKQDDGNLLAAAGASALGSAYEKIEAAYPDKCRRIEEALSRISDAEEAVPFAADEAANALGDLMACLFRWKDDRWAVTLEAMGAALGRFIYMMDAWDDLKKDEKKNRPNPLRGKDLSEESVRELLTVLLGECTMAFETLPLEKDLSILRNILYSGVWTRMEMRSAKQRKEASHGSV